MTTTTEKIQPLQRKNKLAKRWILIIILLVLLLLTALGVRDTLLSRIALAHSSYAPILGNLLVKPSLTPTATATVTATATATATATTTATATATTTATATSTSKPTATKTTAPSSTPETTVKVSGDSVNLRTGPGANFAKVRMLTSGELLILLGRLSDNTWLYVKTSDGQEGWIETTLVDLAGNNVDYHPVKTPPPPEIPTPVALVGIEGHWIDVDLGEQTLYAFDGTDLVASFLVSTGTYFYPTVRGQFNIYAKFRYRDMHGSDYFLPNVPYIMYYDRDFSIHGTYWHHNFGTPMSRGCVNMSISDAEWIYNWSSVGTLVNIHW